MLCGCSARSTSQVNVLRSRVAVVDQRPVLFASSVRENVTYGLRHEVRSGARSGSTVWEGAGVAGFWLKME